MSNHPQHPKNIYHRRLVAPAASKPCFICHKPTPVVLITPDARDFFYACGGHLEDRGFASPTTSDGNVNVGGGDGDGQKQKEKQGKSAELEREIERVKKEWAEKMRRRREGNDKDDGKGGDGKRDIADDKKNEKDGADGDLEREERDDKIAALEKRRKAADADADADADTDTGIGEGDGRKQEQAPRTYTLHRDIFGMRVARIQAQARRGQAGERRRGPVVFPRVPGGEL